MKSFRLFFVPSLLFLVLVACSSEDANMEGVVQLDFMFWGDVSEQKAVEEMVAAFNEEHPDIHVHARHVPDEYETRMTTLLAADDLPDVAYLNTAQALSWARDGHILELTEYAELYPELTKRIPESYLYFDEGKIAGNTTAVETMQLFYNKEIFAELGVEHPPARADEAWSWDEMVEAAKTLTIDRNGNNAHDPNFDPNAIQQYGLSIPGWYFPWHSLLINNGADFFNEDGTEFILDEPEGVEVLQAIQDLMHTHHVAPTPTQQGDMPATSVSLQTKRIAMVIDGQWMINTFANDGLNFGVGVTPVFEKGRTSIASIESGASVIFSSTEYLRKP